MEGHKGFLNEASVTFADKADGKDPKKRERYWMQTLKTMEPYRLKVNEPPCKRCGVTPHFLKTKK